MSSSITRNTGDTAALDLCISSQATEIVRLEAELADARALLARREEDNAVLREMVSRLLQMVHLGTKPGFPPGLGHEAINAAALRPFVAPTSDSIQWDLER